VQAAVEPLPPVLQEDGPDERRVAAIDADRRGNYNFSNVIGPQLHAYPAAK